MSGMSGEIRNMILDKLNAFNRGKTSDKGRYYILLPTPKSLYYTLWFFMPSAVYHPTIYLANLDLNVISSVNKAIKMLSNSFLPLYITTDIKDSPDNGDDIISFGKYRGYHLRDIYTIDPRYVVWIADKYEPRVKSEIRFKELAVAYSKIYIDLQTHKKYKIPVSRFVGMPGEKLSDLRLTITKVRIEDDPFRTQIIRGTEYFYVDQLLTAADIAGNYFLARIKAKDRSLTTRTLPPSAHAFQVGEILALASAKVLKHIEYRTVKYTLICYIKFQQQP